MNSDEKIKAYALCQEYLSAKIESVREAIRNLQSSANEETKSSAGDKYETGRAMAQLEIEKSAAQLAELLKQKTALDAITVNKIYTTVQPGSFITTDQGIYFLSISAGKISLVEKSIFCISASSPVGSKLLGLKAGDNFSFNQRNFKILEVS
jgi:transcription elongation GreA/GreB family factor